MDQDFIPGGNKYEVWNRMAIGSAYIGTRHNLYHRACPLSGRAPGNSNKL
jgi:hypothetical protein